MNQEAREPVAAEVETSVEAQELTKLDGGEGQSMAPDVPDEEATRIHVLLVEDESLIAEIIGEALIDAGHAVHSCSNAEDALVYISSGSRVDVLFTDINLPGDMDGAALAESARKADPTLALIFASGRWGLLDRLRGCPNAKILQKPYSPARACEAVEFLAAAKFEARDERDAKRVRELALAL
jgi:DNA-binding response OmpR family regulator